MKFKVGNRVRRIRDEHLGMVAGDVDEVIAATRYSIQLKKFFGNAGWHDSQNFELVEEAKVDEPKIKAGARVRALDSSGGIRKGEVYVVKHVEPSGDYDGGYRVYLVVDSQGSTINGWGIKHFELVKSELEELVELYNSGLAARETMIEKYSKDVQYFCNDGSLHEPVPKSSRVSRVEIKPKPKFEPYTIKNKGWEVRIANEYLLIGCESFNRKELKAALASLIGGDSHPHTQFSKPLVPARNGDSLRQEHPPLGRC